MAPFWTPLFLYSIGASILMTVLCTEENVEGYSYVGVGFCQDSTGAFYYGLRNNTAGPITAQDCGDKCGALLPSLGYVGFQMEVSNIYENDSRCLCLFSYKQLAADFSEQDFQQSGSTHGGVGKIASSFNGIDYLPTYCYSYDQYKQDTKSPIRFPTYFPTSGIPTISGTYYPTYPVTNSTISEFPTFSPTYDPSSSFGSTRPPMMEDPTEENEDNQRS